MITEQQLKNLGFIPMLRSKYDPSFQSYGFVYMKHKLAIDGHDYREGMRFEDLSGQVIFETLKELDQYFIGCGRKSIFID
jgi:hypothetical protein